MKQTPTPSIDLGPGSSRLWVFPLERTLSPEAETAFLGALQRFVESWQAHKAPVQGRVAVYAGKFALVAADEESVRVSGCSNDSLHRAVQEAAELAGTRLCNPENVHFAAHDGGIHSVTRSEFKKLAAEGQVDSGTIVYDPLATTVRDFLDGKFERSLDSSWHRRLLP